LVNDGKMVHCKDGNVIYIEMLFDSQDVVYANGAATEIFDLGKVGIAAVDDASWAAVFAILPELRADLSRYGTTAQRCLRQHQAPMVRM
jgi:hypothetical protein